MGADIHWYSETKKEGKWYADTASSFRINDEDPSCVETELDGFPNRIRDYWFFGLLQPCVRTEWKWSFPEHVKFPTDASSEVRDMFKSWEGDAHSEGFLTGQDLKTKLSELKLLQAEHLISPIVEIEALQHHIKRLNQTLDTLKIDCRDEGVADENRRIVFWFDN